MKNLLIEQEHLYRESLIQFLVNSTSNFSSTFEDINVTVVTELLLTVVKIHVCMH